MIQLWEKEASDFPGDFMRFFLVLAALWSFTAHATDLRLDIVALEDLQGQPLPAATENEPVRLVLKLTNERTGKAILPKDLQISHEKLFHLFAFDAGLTNYLHEHPEARADTWLVVATFRRAGTYQLWSDVTLQARREEVRSRTEIRVVGPSAPNPMPGSLPPVAEGADGISVLTLRSVDDLRPGEMSMPTLHFSRSNGTKPQITPYLGAMAHVVITNLSGTELIHAHPMDHGGQFMIHTEFPEAGDYRLFVQFVDGGILRTVELAVSVR